MSLRTLKNDLKNKLSLSRNAGTGKYLIDIRVSEYWKLSYSRNFSDIYDEISSVEFRVPTSVEIPCFVTERMLFMVEDVNTKVYLSETLINLQGAYNMRDIGGVINNEGKQVAYGKIYRSDDLCNLTEQDLMLLKFMQIQTVVDFRSTDEIEKYPDKLPQGCNYIELTIDPGNMNAANIKLVEKATLEEVENYMIGVYEYFGRGGVTKQLKTLFEALLDSKGKGIIYHCSAGKDRTGFASALILHALGVDKDAIIADYMCSNEYSTIKYKDYVEKYPNLLPMFKVKKEYLEKTFEVMENKFGSIDNYIEKELCVDIEKFREMFLI